VRFFEGAVFVLFRLPEPADDGEDMTMVPMSRTDRRQLSEEWVNDDRRVRSFLFAKYPNLLTIGINFVS